MKILVDSREQGERKSEGTRKSRAKAYYTNKGYTCEIKQLEVGDYTFDNKVVFEYKSISDFMSSTFNSRLFDEVTNQTNQYDYSYLIIVGDLQDYVLDTWESYRIKQKYRQNFNKFIKSCYGAYDGSIRRVQTVCPVLYAPTEEIAFQEMLLQSQKCLDNKVYGSQVKRKANFESPVDVVLASVKNISDKKAKTIKESLGIKNLNDLMKCTIEDFKSVKFIGETTATTLYEFIHKEEV